MLEAEPQVPELGLRQVRVPEPGPRQVWVPELGLRQVRVPEPGPRQEPRKKRLPELVKGQRPGLTSRALPALWWTLHPGFQVILLWKQEVARPEQAPSWRPGRIQ